MNSSITKMKNIALLYFLALAVIGCSSHQSSSEVVEILYTCDRGDPIQVRFYQNREVAILVRGGEVTELQQEPVGSGFRYSNGPTSIRGKGNDLMVLIGRMAAINCAAQ